jgi:hypothetical protein
MGNLRDATSIEVVDRSAAHRGWPVLAKTVGRVVLRIADADVPLERNGDLGSMQRNRRFLYWGHVRDSLPPGYWRSGYESPHFVSITHLTFDRRFPPAREIDVHQQQNRVY